MQDFKVKNQENNFRSYVLNLIYINISFFSIQGLVVPGQLIGQLCLACGRFISQPCHNSQMEWANLSAKRAH